MSEPVKVAFAANEIEAAAIISSLADAGIHAEAIGGLTSGLRAEAPGDVAIMVRGDDAERARELLDKHA
ncbi:MAG: putative signal transducing protein [Planctomycetota bacterium]|jgi:hypothetical protein